MSGCVRFFEMMDYTMFPMAMTMSSAPTTCYIKQESSASYQEDTILDLCVRKRVRTESPDYTLSYPSPKSTPEYEDLMSPVSSPKTTDTTSECSEPNSRTSSTSPEPTCRTRPFKAFPKEPFSLHLVPQIPTLPDPDYRDYEEFRKKMLAQVQSCHNSSNKNMRRNQVQSGKNNDPEYLERRKKNNEAAKRSRDARKAKEDEIAIRCAYLEQQNISLKYKLAALNNELEKLRCMMYR